jgi:integrase
MTDIQQLLRQHLADTLREDRERHLVTPHGRPVYAHSSAVDDNTSPTDADLAAVTSWLDERREALATRDFSLVKHQVDEYMTTHSIDETHRNELALGLLHVEVQYLEAARRRVVGGVAMPLEEPRTSAEPVANVPSGPKLSEALPTFIDVMTKDAGWRGQTLLQNNGTYRMLMQRCGDLPVGAYTRRHLGEMFDLLRGLPAMYAKDRRWKNMTPVQVAEVTKGDASIPRLAMKTIKRHFAALGSLFTYFIERGQYEGNNPAHGFRFPQKGRPSQKRDAWGAEKLRQLFASPVWTGCKSTWERSKPGSVILKDDKYWLPLLGIYHGNRLEEFAQLKRSDVRSVEGILYFDINDEGDKQVKNEQSKRRVPIHPALLSAGFLDYVNAIASVDDDPLFPQLPPGGADNKRGHAFSKWFTRYRRDIGVYDPKLNYHSFRHDVTTKLLDAEVSEWIIEELVGHEGKGTTRVVYNKGMTMRKLYDAICKIEWPGIALTKSG